MNVVDLFRQADLFKGLSEEGLSELAAASRCLKIKKRQVLFVEGESGASVFLMEKGVVHLYKATPGGKEVLIRTVRSGEMFAEVVLFEQNRYPVTAMVAQSGSLYTVPKSKIHQLLEKREFRNRFIGEIFKRHRYLTNRILYLSAHDSEERFRLYLKEQFSGKPGRFPALPKKSVAAAISVTPETLSRILLKYRKEIVWSGGEIKIAPSFWGN